MLWWDEKLATGIENIDNQHRDIFDKAEKVLSFDEGSCISEVKNMLGYLIRYTVNHFADEEDTMMQTGYPDFLNHREQHTYFMNELFIISTDIKDNGICEKNMDGLKLLVIEWLADHITESDREFVDFYKGLQ